MEAPRTVACVIRTGSIALLLPCLLLFSDQVSSQTNQVFTEEAGIHFLVPHGYDYGTELINSDEGIIHIVRLETEGGGPTFLFRVFPAGTALQDAVDRVVHDLQTTFDLSHPADITRSELSLAGELRRATRIVLGVGDTEVVCFVGGFQVDGVVVVAQALGGTIESDDSIMEAVFSRLGVGEAPLLEPPDMQPESVVPIDEGTGDTPIGD